MSVTDTDCHLQTVKQFLSVSANPIVENYSLRKWTLLVWGSGVFR